MHIHHIYISISSLLSLLILYGSYRYDKFVLTLKLLFVITTHIAAIVILLVLIIIAMFMFTTAKMIVSMTFYIIRITGTDLLSIVI